MRIVWKTTDAQIASHADWRERLERKNRQQGTSAPTLAAAWSGPVEVLGALRRLPQFADLVLEQIIVERESHFDPYGGPRNHDLVARGQLPDGSRVVVCVEAKAGEDLGQTVEQYARAAQAKRERGESTNAPERLRDLLAKYVPHHAATEERVGRVRYQLLSALAGTEAEATEAGAEHAVLVIHEFRTDQRSEDKTSALVADLQRFVTAVFDSELPGPQPMPWCVEVPAPSSMTARLYVAWAVTDLRTATLESGSALRRR
jgi:hypothetical protein